MAGDDMWQKIVNRETVWEQSESLRGRQYTWRQVPVHTVTLACGHQLVYRGDKVPKVRVRCKQCLEGATQTL